jgi:DNA-binding NtrC family response regulator
MMTNPEHNETNAPHRMLIVDDKKSVRTMLVEVFRDRDFDISEAGSGEEAIELINKSSFQIVLSDLSMPNKSGIDVLRAAKSRNQETEVIIATGYGTIEIAVEAMRLGAHDFITKPINIAELERKVDKIVRKIETADQVTMQTWIHPGIQHMVGASRQTKDLMKMILRVAPSKSSVLITGPSGVGKELVARAIHEASPRRDNPFIAVNCAALAPGTLESELFGHEAGAFTGANTRRIGRFEKANEGTLFLDEVAEIEPAVQTKLLRTLQEGEIDRVGGTKTIKVDCRIVAATNRNLEEAIKAGDFREDFFYRLNVISLTVAPLRERREDIPALVDHFLRKYSIELAKEVYEVEDDVFAVFLQYPWPGNVRELENVIERAVVLAETDCITRNELPEELIDRQEIPEPLEPERGGAEPLPDQTEKLESDLIRGALEKFHWNKTKTAEHLGLKRTTLQYKIKKYGLD